LSWHAIGQPFGCQLRFEVPPNPRVLQIKVNEGTALSNTDHGPFSRHRPPEADRVLTSAGTQRQLTYRLLVCVSRAEMLVKPTCARAHHCPFLPRRPYDLVFVPLFIWANAGFPWPHQGVAAPADNRKHPHPLNELVLYGIAPQAMRQNGPPGFCRPRYDS